MARSRRDSSIGNERWPVPRRAGGRGGGRGLGEGGSVPIIRTLMRKFIAMFETSVLGSSPTSLFFLPDNKLVMTQYCGQAENIHWNYAACIQLTQKCLTFSVYCRYMSIFKYFYISI